MFEITLLTQISLPDHEVILIQVDLEVGHLVELVKVGDVSLQVMGRFSFVITESTLQVGTVLVNKLVVSQQFALSLAGKITIIAVKIFTVRMFELVSLQVTRVNALEIAILNFANVFWNLLSP